MNEQDGTQATVLQRPTTNDPQAWKAYWKAQGQSWRSEPEIDDERQKELDKRRAIVPNIEKGIYPFKDIEPKLSRADIEWLLATHEQGLGPVDWSNEKQREREGLDLRGVDLRQANLHHLPLIRLRGGLAPGEWKKSTPEQRAIAVALMEGANLSDAQLNGAYLGMVELKNANLYRAKLEGAYLRWAKLEGAHLERAQLKEANLKGVVLGDQRHIGPRLANVQWNDTNLAVVDWSQVTTLGDEYEAKQKTRDGKEKDNSIRLREYQSAVRANRQLAVALQAQGINEDSARFAYRAQKLQRVVMRLQRKFGQYLFSLFLDLLAGYGYRPGRSVFWYLVIIVGFAFAYYALGHLSLFPPDAFVYSVTSFHGRGFFPGIQNKPSLHDPLVMLAAIEAVIGLFIEISFIATFTKRFFGS